MEIDDKQKIEQYLENAVDWISAIADVTGEDTVVRFSPEETKIVVNGDVVYITGHGPNKWKV